MGVSARTLWTLRKEGRGPRFVKVGSQVRYRIEAIREWLESQEATVAGGGE
jgi:predicted DNA-binding transcriptional regulator AlpA